MQAVNNAPSDLNQDGLHGKVPLPLANARQLCEIDFAISLVHTRDVDLGHEGYFWGCVWVVGSAVDLQAVYAILVCALRCRRRALAGCGLPWGLSVVDGSSREVVPGLCRSSWSSVDRRRRPTHTNTPLCQVSRPLHVCDHDCIHLHRGLFLLSPAPLAGESYEGPLRPWLLSSPNLTCYDDEC